MTQGEQIELLAALVQRKWRALNALGTGETLTPQGQVRLDLVRQQYSEELAAASMLLKIAQDERHKGAVSGNSICGSCGRETKWIKGGRPWCLSCRP